MKNTLLKFAGFIACSGLLFLAGCSKTDTTTTDQRDQYVGSWLCDQTDGTKNETTFTIDIAKTGTTSITISNFNNLGSKVVPNCVVSTNTFSITKQTLDGFTVSGSGVYNAGKIEMSYDVDDNTNGKKSYTATCTKK